MRVWFACGHAAEIAEKVAVSPRCMECGETRVRSVQARPPSFRGTVTGPYAEFKALEAVPVSLAETGPMRLKPPKD